MLQDLPEIQGYRPERVDGGKSGSAVYRLTRHGRSALFLKISTPGDDAELETENLCLQWLAGRAAVARVLSHGVRRQRSYLVTEALPGTHAASLPDSLWSNATESMAFHLRQLHSLPVDDCPFDRTLDQMIPMAAERLSSGRVDPLDFDPERLGMSAAELISVLRLERPRTEDVVVCHGDASLRNMMFDDQSFSGFVDCGRCGLADRHQDLAIAHRSIGKQFGSRLAEHFLSSYGWQYVDSRKLSYYRLLDEFF